jgi:hypothetical protein
MIHGAPNASAMMASATVATIQDDLVSIDCTCCRRSGIHDRFHRKPIMLSLFECLTAFPRRIAACFAGEYLEQIHVSMKHEFAPAFFVRTFGRKTGFHFS